jgi:hypothetical protein
MADTDFLGTENSRQTLGLAGLGALGIALMFGGGSLLYGGGAIVIGSCGLIGYLHRHEIASAASGRGGLKHLGLPAACIAILLFGAVVLLYRRLYDHPVTLFQFFWIAWTLGLAAGWRILTDPESWVLVFALWGFWMVIDQGRQQAKPAAPPSIADDPAFQAAIDKIKGQIAEDRAAATKSALEYAPMANVVAVIPVRRTAPMVQWSKATSYELGDAASLWVDQLPPRALEQRSAEAEAVLGRLQGAIMDNSLEAMPSPLGSFFGAKEQAGPKTRVTRQALIAFAKSQHDKPWFLFPA